MTDPIPSNIVTIMQVRMTSSRLPGKVLMPLLGEPVFIRQLERMQGSKLIGKIIVATTTQIEDDPIEKICLEKGIDCFRGHPTDLLDRHYQAAKLYGADVVLKIPSDCPLIDPRIIDRTIGYYLDNRDQFDFVSNLHPATFPDGNDVEIMPFEMLERACKDAKLELEREHTTPYFWERPEIFRIGNIAMEDGSDLSLIHRWTIDYKEDYDFIKKVYEELYPKNPLFSLEEILELLKKHPEIYQINSELAGVNWYRNHLDELKTVDITNTKLK